MRSPPLVKRGGVVGVDLAAVAFMDAAGLKVLCAAADALGDRGRLAHFDPNPHVFRLLTITGLTDLIADVGSSLETMDAMRVGD